MSWQIDDKNIQKYMLSLWSGDVGSITKINTYFILPLFAPMNLCEQKLRINKIVPL